LWSRPGVRWERACSGETWGGVLFRSLFGWFLHLGAVGLVLLGVLDSSFLFIPLGNDLLLALLVARHHEQLPVYVLAAAAGSMIGRSRW
jgi:membrane protein YqaA with SNARE-associated domain